MPDLRTKALGYLRDGRVRVLTADTRQGDLRPYRVTGLVQGHNGRYGVALREGYVWRCACGAPDSSEPVCAHASAVAMVTGWPSPGDRHAPSGTGRDA